jgi:hypothetical protein
MVNPYDGKSTSVELNVCNASKTTKHSFQGASVKVASFTPHAGTLNTWIPSPCDTTYFTPPSNVVEIGGCGGSVCPTDFNLMGAFAPGDGLNATAAAKDSDGVLPLNLAPDKVVTGFIRMTIPVAAGTHTFSMSLMVDGATTTYGGATSPALYDPSPQTWSGAACTKPAMLALIPPSPVANNICPAT